MKKLMLFSICALTSLCLIACSGKSDNIEPKNTTISDTTVPAGTQKGTAGTKATEAATTKEEANITLTIPADFIGDSTQEDLNNAAKEYGYKAVLNADGSATYTMTKSQHKKMMDDLSEELKTSLDEMVGSEDYPNFTNIEVNSDFTKFTITTKSEELDFNESFSVIGFYMYSGMYHVFNGTEAGDVTVEFVNAESGKVIYSSDSENMEESTSTETQKNQTTISEFKEITVVDNDKCAIKITGIEPGSSWGYTLKTYMENKSSDKTYMFSVENAAINGVQCDPFFATEVAAGKKANDRISFSDSTLKKNGITDLTDIEISFRVYDSNDWVADNVVEEIVHVYPYGEENAIQYTRNPQNSDIVLVDNEYVTAIITGFEKDGTWGYTANLFLVNKTDTEVMFSVDEASVNGYMIDPFYSTSVAAGKCAFSSMSWSDTKLKENGITEVTEIEFLFKAYDNDNWSSDRFVNETFTINP